VDCKKIQEVPKMANIIQKMLNVELLLAIGLLLSMIGSASYIPEVIKSTVAPFAGIGALLVVIAAGMAIYNKLKK